MESTSRPDQTFQSGREHEFETVTPAAIKWLFSSRKTAEDICNLLKLADYVDRAVQRALETENLDILWPDYKAQTPSVHSVESEDWQKMLVAHSDSQRAMSTPLSDIEDADTESQTSLREQEDHRDHQPSFIEIASSDENDEPIGVYELPDGVRKEMELAIPKLIVRGLAGLRDRSALFLEYAPALVYRLVLDRMTTVPGIYLGNFKDLLLGGLELDESLITPERPVTPESDPSVKSMATSLTVSIQQTPEETPGEIVKASPPAEGNSNWLDRTSLGPHVEESHLSDLSSNFYDHAPEKPAENIGNSDPEQDLRLFAKRALRPRRRSESPEAIISNLEDSEEEGASVIVKGDGSVLTPTAYLCRAFGLSSLNESL